MADFPKTRCNQRNAAGIRDGQEQTVADLIEIVGIGARDFVRFGPAAVETADRLLQCSEIPWPSLIFRRPPKGDAGGKILSRFQFYEISAGPGPAEKPCLSPWDEVVIESRDSRPGEGV
jgi:hypothetical protein